MALSPGDGSNEFGIHLIGAAVGIPGNGDVLFIYPVAELAQAWPVDHEKVIIKTHAVDSVVLSQERKLFQDPCDRLPAIFPFVKIDDVTKRTAKEAATGGDRDNFPPGVGVSVDVSFDRYEIPGRHRQCVQILYKRPLGIYLNLAVFFIGQSQNVFVPAMLFDGFDQLSKSLFTFIHHDKIDVGILERLFGKQRGVRSTPYDLRAGFFGQAAHQNSIQDGRAGQRSDADDVWLCSLQNRTDIFAVRILVQIAIMNGDFVGILNNGGNRHQTKRRKRQGVVSRPHVGIDEKYFHRKGLGQNGQNK